MNAAFAWLALEANPVVVSVHGNDFLSPYVPVERPALARVPLLWRYRQGMAAIEDVWGQIMTRRMLRRALPRASRILANSRYTEQTLLDRLPACTGRTSAGMVGVSEAFLNSPATRPVGRNDRLVTVCRLADRRKSVDAVLSALAELKERHAFTYTVIGDGHLRGELERLTMQLGLQERVTFTGFLPLDEVRRHLAESDLFILASSVIPGSHEGFGIAYLEANACGTPVLAARLAGAVEAVKEGVTGMFVDTPSVPSLVDALDSFLSGRAEFRPEACRAFARGFTWRKVVDQAVPWYERRAHTDAAETALTS
jgi:glycosyltransferase involved in cell wall biosynthesis